MKFTYRAYDRAGHVVSDAVEAASLADAGEMLRKQGLFVSDLAADRAGGKSASDGGSGGGSGRFGGKTARLRAMSVLVRQLSVLVSTGTPMVEAISSLEKQLPAGRWRSAVEDIRSRIEQGASLSAALEHHSEYFDPVARSLIAAGESGGKLDDMLKRLATLSRQQLKIRASIAGAMVYPCLLICVCVGVLGTMMFFVLPRFEGLFETLGAPLPPTTKLVMDISKFLRDYWWGVLAGIILAMFGVRYWLRTAAGRKQFHSFILKAPQMGKLVRAFATARITRVLGVLVEGRVPLLDALRLTRESTGNVCYEELIAQAEEIVTRGESVSAALSESPLINESIVEAIRSGERSGQLGPVLLSVSEFLDEDNEVILRSLSSIIEPVILIVLGVLIGFVAVSMFLPLFDLATATNAGGS